MKKFLLFLFFFSLKEALGASGVINKIYQNRMAAEAFVLKNKLNVPGSFLVAKFQGGNVCYLEILKIRYDRALLDLRLCSMKDYIQIGQKLGSDIKWEPDVDLVSIDQKTEVKISEMEDYWKDPLSVPEKIVKGFSAVLQYSFADKIEFVGQAPNIMGTQNSYHGFLEAEGAVGIGIDYIYSKENNFGWNFDGSLEFPRNFDYLSASTIGVDFNGPITNNQLWLGILALNLNFTFPKTYILYAGINCSLPIVSGGDFKPGSQFGFQLGLSKLFGKHLIMDVEYRWLNFRGGIQTPNEVIQFTSTQFDGFLLRLKYLFN